MQLLLKRTATTLSSLNTTRHHTTPRNTTQHHTPRHNTPHIPHHTTTHKHTNTRTHEHTNTRTHEHTNTQTHKHTNTKHTKLTKHTTHNNNNNTQHNTQQHAHTTAHRTAHSTPHTQHTAHTAHSTHSTQHTTTQHTTHHGTLSPLSRFSLRASPPVAELQKVSLTCRYGFYVMDGPCLFFQIVDKFDADSLGVLCTFSCNDPETRGGRHSVCLEQRRSRRGLKWHGRVRRSPTVHDQSRRLCHERQRVKITWMPLSGAAALRTPLQICSCAQKRWMKAHCTLGCASLG